MKYTVGGAKEEAVVALRMTSKNSSVSPVSNSVEGIRLPCNYLSRIRI